MNPNILKWILGVDMKSGFVFCSAIVVSLLLAGCQSDGTSENYRTHSVSPAAEPGWVSPPPVGGHISREYSRSKTKSWVSSDGTIHRRSSGTSVNMSVDPGAAAGMIADLLVPTSGGRSDRYSTAAIPQNYLGRWNISTSGRECSLTLREGRGNGGSATVFGCLGTDISDVRRWSLRGYEVVLVGMFDKEVASLRVTQPNRMDGLVYGKTQVTAWR
jgi:hypothetical protein